MTTRIVIGLLLCFISTPHVPGQVQSSKSSVLYKYKNRTINTRRISDVNRLAEVITYGKDTDKEKVEAIFKWVAINIDFDYRKGLLIPGITSLDVTKTLARKRGVSLQYAMLIDTLCTLSGIKCKRVFGYAKDEFFDVNDSIYPDNHVWNAIKIDNQWHLLDATSASGTPFYRYTRFSSLIVKLKNRYAIRYRAIIIKQNKSFFFKYDCIKPDSVTALNRYVRYAPLVTNKLLYTLLGKFRLKVVRDYYKTYNPGYFLIKPESFAVKCHPNNPHWLLTSGVGKIRKFETDSAYYHYTDSTLGKRSPTGRYCIECDNELPRDDINYYYDLRQKSSSFNKRNRLALAFCEYNIAGMKFKEAQKAEDSLTKVTLLDTSLSYFRYALNNIAIAQVYAKIDNALQKEKNAKKLYLLTDENLNYYDGLKQQINKSYFETENIRDLKNRIHLFAKMFYRRNLVIRDFISGGEIKQSPLTSQATVQNLLLKEKFLLGYVDSLTTLIESTQSAFDQKLQPIAAQVWKKVFWQDSLLYPLKKSTEFRRMMKDNFKKEVVETRKDYKRMMDGVSSDLDSLIFLPAATVSANGNKVLSLMDERYFVHLEIHKIKRQLVKFKVIRPKELDDYRTLIRRENHLNFCWTRGGTSELRQLFYGFEALGQRLGFLQRELKTEIEVEGTRYRFVERELRKRTQKLELVLRNNREVLHEKARETRKYKRDYLRALRKVRNEERKKNNN